MNIGELLFLFRDQNGSTLDLSLPSKVCPESHKNSKTTCSIVFLRKAAIPHILGTTSVSAGGMGRPRLQLVALIVTSMCCTETRHGPAWPGMARHVTTRQMSHRWTGVAGPTNHLPSPRVSMLTFEASNDLLKCPGFLGAVMERNSCGKFIGDV